MSGDPIFDPEKRWSASSRPWGRNPSVLLPEGGGENPQHKGVERPGFVRPEPRPIPHAVDAADERHPKIVDLVIKDMNEKAEKGKEKYGTYLQPFNGRDPLIDRYQELLDACQYARQEIFEKYGK